jgi:REP element-mobilizing transposase RayT
MPNRGGPLDAGPRAHVHCDSTQASSRVRDRVPERKRAIAMARLSGKDKNFSGEHFWARGYAVSTVGFELEQVRQYIREPDAADGNGQF